eukprot:1016703-Rhodomonas_salina.2
MVHTPSDCNSWTAAKKHLQAECLANGTLRMEQVQAAIGVVEDQNIQHETQAQSQLASTKSAVTNKAAAKPAVAGITPAMQETLDKHLAAVTAMLASAQGTAGGNGCWGGKSGGGWKGNCKPQRWGNNTGGSGKQPDGTFVYTNPVCDKCNHSHKGECMKGSNLQEVKHYIEALIKIQELKATQQGWPTAAEPRQANTAAAAAASISELNTDIEGCSFVSLTTCPWNPDAPTDVK